MQAKKDKIKADKKKALLKKENTPHIHTGLIHRKNGQREFPEGGIVGGVNNWIGGVTVTANDKKEQETAEEDEPLAEKEAKHKELRAANIAGKK